MQSSDQISADLFAEDVFQAVPCDRLVVGDGGQDSDIVLAQIEVLFTYISGGPDRRNVSGPHPQHPTTGDLRHFE
jgi:hypothetical protein